MLLALTLIALLQILSLPSVLASGPTAHQIPDSEFSDPDSADFPLNPSALAEFLGESLFSDSSSSGLDVSDDEAPGPSTPLPRSPPTRPLLPKPPVAPLPRPQRPRLFPLRYDNASVPAQPTGASRIAWDDLITERLSTELDEPYKLRCWTGLTSRHMSPISPDPADCEHALGMLISGDKKNAPILFSENYGYKVPRRVAWNTCAIVLTIAEEDDAAITTTFKEIESIVRILMMHCINLENDERGGMFTFGKMIIALAGRAEGRTATPGIRLGTGTFE